MVKKFVVDTNCVISALIKSSSSRHILCSEHVLFCAPEHLFTELLNHKTEILEKAGITQNDFSLLLSALLPCIHLCPETEFRRYKERALALVEHEEDAPFVALCLAKSLPLWSNDKGFKKQAVVRVFSTAELIDELRKSKESLGE